MDELAIIRALKQPTNLIACGFEKITVTGAVASVLDVVTEGKGLGATYAEISVESAVAAPCARFLMLGATLLPTTTNGIGLSNGVLFDISNGDNLANFRAIAVSGSTTLQVQYYK